MQSENNDQPLTSQEPGDNLIFRLKDLNKTIKVIENE